MWSVDNLDFEEDESIIQRLVLAKGILQHKIEKEVRGNAELHASLERIKYFLHKLRLELEQEVLSLQELSQAEKNLRVALEVQNEKRT